MPVSRAGDTSSEDIWNEPNEAIHTAEGSYHFNVNVFIDQVTSLREEFGAVHV